MRTNFKYVLIVASILMFYVILQASRFRSVSSNRSRTKANRHVFQKQLENKRKLLEDEVEVNCSGWDFPSSVKAEKSPKFFLNPNKFLYPGLIWGPNNQFLGLSHSIYLAIIINRTLVIPQFHAQHNHPGLVHPYEFLNIKRLCSFVSCISIEDLREECNGSFDVAFEGMESYVTYTNMFEEDTGMSMVHPKRVLDNIPDARKLRLVGVESELPTLPRMDYIKKYGLRMPMSPEFLRKAYRTSAPCAIFTAVFDPILAYATRDLALPLDPKVSSVDEVDPQDLYSAVLDAMHHPPCVVKAAQEYIREVLNDESFIGIHWRYDPDDWIGRMCKNFIKENITVVCGQLENLRPFHIVNAVKRVHEEEASGPDRWREIIPVYIATPTFLEAFKEHIYDLLEGMTPRFVRPLVSLEEFVRARYNSMPPNKWENTYSLLSLIEMEIMKRSTFFLYSRESTWSDMIRPYRTSRDRHGNIAKKYNGDILNLASEELLR